jgi:hypothetical protein
MPEAEDYMSSGELHELAKGILKAHGLDNQ